MSTSGRIQRARLRPRPLCILSFGASLFLLAAAALAQPAGESADGWQKLWANRNHDAKIAFRAALKQHPADTAALRGLAVLALQEDDQAAAVQALRPLYRMAPGHWSALAYWPQFAAAAEETGRWSVLQEAARAVLASKSTGTQLRASARLALAEAALRAGKLPEAEQQWAALAGVRRWQVIGPFDNASRSGFGNVYPPEKECSLKASYRGKDDLLLAWHPLATVARSGRCGVGLSLADYDDGAFYAVTALSSPKEQPARLAFDPTGAARAWVNGTLVFSDEERRKPCRLLADAFLVPAALRAGWNTVLVKLAGESMEDVDFSLRVLSPSGAELKLPADPAQAAAAPPAGAPAAAATTPAEPAAVALVRAGSEAKDAEALASIAWMLRTANDCNAAAETMRKALAAAPQCGWLHWELSRVLKEDGQTDEAKAERELALKANPQLVDAALDALDDTAEKATPAQRLAQVKALLQRAPQSSKAQWALSDAYTRAGLKADALKAARAAVALAPGDASVGRLFSTLSLRGRRPEAQKLLADALRAAPNSGRLLESRASTLQQEDKDAAAAAVYERLLWLDVPDPRYRQRLSGLYQGMRNLKKAAQELRAARAQRPQDAGLCSQLAELLQETGDKKGAIALYQTAIRLDPGQVWLRHKLDVLTGEKPVADLAPGTPAGPILAKTPKPADLPGASSVFLLDEAREVVYPDYSSVQYTHQIIKVLDAAGAKRRQTFPLSVGSAWASATVESARVIKADGKIQDFTDEVDEDEESVSFPSLAAGDTIDISYRVEEHKRGGLSRQFWQSWYFWDGGEAVKLSRYVLITPPGMALQTRTHGAVPEPAVKDVKGWRIREWRVSDMPARKFERQGSRDDSAYWLDVSTVSSWADIVRWYRDLAQPRCVPDPAVRAKALELTKDAKTETDKIRAIVHFVARDIEYQSTPFRMSAFVPTEGKQVLRERYGDCKDKAALVTALLAAVGIKAEMALLSPRDQGLTPYLPSPRFSHAVACVRTAQGPLWVDATADQMGFGYFPIPCQGVPALLISDATTDLTTTPVLPVETNRMTERYQAVLAADGKLTATAELETTGNWAWMLRTALRMVPEGNRDDVLREMVTAMADNPHYESGSVTNLDDPDKPLLMRVKYRADRYSSEAGNFLLFRLPHSNFQADSGIDAIADDPKRQDDLEMADDSGYYTASVRIELPAGYTPQELKPEVRGQSPWGSYRFSYRMEGSVLVSDSEMKVPCLRVPAKDIPAYAEFVRASGKEATRQFVFKKGS